MAWFSKTYGAQQVEITIATGTVVRVLLGVIISLLVLAALRKFTDGLIIVGVAAFLALALNAPVHWIASHFPGRLRGSRSLATSVAFIIVVGLLASFIALLAPIAIKETSSFAQSVPRLVETLQDENSTLGNFINRNNLNDAIDDATSQVADSAKQSSGKIFTSIGGGIFVTLTTLVLVFMMLVEGPKWIAIGQRLAPKDKQKHLTQLAGKMYRVIKGYVNGQVLLAAVAAICILVAMLIIGVPYAGALAFVVFFAALIPMIGHFIGATIVTLVALTNSWIAALVILGFYIFYQQIENYIVQPRVQSNATNMSPLLVFLAVVLGANFSGLLGALVAIPIAGCLRILVLDYLETHGMITKKEASTAINQE